MDLLHFLDTRIRFVFQLYDSCIAPYEERKRRIEANEPPFVDRRNPEDYDEPAFLEEWTEADDSIMVIGQWCLCMLQAALHAYLSEFVSPRGSYFLSSEEMLAELKTKKADNNFGRYRLLFVECLGIDWNDGPVTIAALEQLNLTRNDLQHNLGIFTLNVERTSRHAERFPEGLFTDELWSDELMDRIRINRSRLRLGAHLVMEFCKWLDGFRCNHPNEWQKIYDVKSVALPSRD